MLKASIFFHNFMLATENNCLKYGNYTTLYF